MAKCRIGTAKFFTLLLLLYRTSANEQEILLLEEWKSEAHQRLHMEQEQRKLKDRAAALQEELSKSQAATVNAEKFMGIVRKHLAFEELTPTLLREMIEKIVVHECSYDENGTRRQDIEIYYSFVGKIDLPEA